MQNKDAEIALAHYGYKLQTLIARGMTDWTIKLCENEGRFRASGQYGGQTDSAHHLGYTLLQQTKVNYIRYLSRESEEIETLEILLGYDPEWNPVISVSSTKTQPVKIESKGVADEDMAAIRKQVRRCFDNAGLNFDDWNTLSLRKFPDSHGHGYDTAKRF